MRERPVVEVREAVDRGLRRGEMVRAAAGDGERVGDHVERPGAHRGGRLARHRRRAVRRPVVDQHDAIDRAQQRRQRPGQCPRLVLHAHDRGHARARRVLRPAPAHVEVRVTLEVGDGGGVAGARPAGGPGLELRLGGVHALGATLGERVELPDAQVLVDRAAQQRQDRLGPALPVGARARLGRHVVVAVARQVGAVAAPHDGGGRVVVRAGRQRQRAGVPSRRRRGGDAGVGVQQRDRVRQPLGATDVPERQLRDEVVLDRPVDVLGVAGAERRDEAAEVLDDAGRRLRDAREPRLLAVERHEARLAEQQLGQPARPQALPGVAHDA